MSHSEAQNQQGRKVFSHGARETVNICREIHPLMSKGHQISKNLTCTISEQQDLDGALKFIISKMRRSAVKTIQTHFGKR